MQKTLVKGRIDEAGKVLVPITVVASDGFELEVEVAINLQFSGSLMMAESLCTSLGWRCLGARRVLMGTEQVHMHHFIGLIALGGEPVTVVVLGGPEGMAFLGQKMLIGGQLRLDYRNGLVELEYA